MGHVTVMVPEGHAIQVHPPGAVTAPMQQGMVPDPAMAGAKAAMDAALPVPSEQKSAPKDKAQPKRKKKPAEKPAKEKASGKQD